MNRFTFSAIDELLTLEVVTPIGGFLRETSVDEVVLRPCERRFSPGSEVAVFPAHGPMLVRVADAELRYHQACLGRRLHVSGGIAEVRNDTVVVLARAPSG